MEDFLASQDDGAPGKSRAVRTQHRVSAKLGVHLEESKRMHQIDRAIGPIVL